jgi:DNA-binding NtrC family response regulator
MEFPSEGRGGRLPRPPAELLRLHRHSLTSLLVIGGLSDVRRAVAHAFHDEGPLRNGPFVHVDCRSDEPRLRSALRACLTGTTEGDANPLFAAWGGTLFLDAISALGAETQRLLLCALERTGLGGENGAETWPLRLGAGDDESLAAAVQAGRFLPALYDGLDKIRVDLSPELAA